MVRALSLLIFFIFSTPLFAEVDLFPIDWNSLSFGQKFFVSTEIKTILGQPSDKELSEKEFQDLYTKVIQTCQTQVAQAAQCTELKIKLQHFVPYETSLAYTNLKEALTNSDFEETLMAASDLQVEMENDFVKFQQQCEESIPSYKELYCKNLAIRTQKAQKLLSKSVDLIELKQIDNDCVNCSKEKLPSSSVPTSSIPDVPIQCTEEEQKTKQDACLKDIGCTIASTVFSFTATPVIETLSKNSSSCVSMQNDCITNVITSIAKSLYSLVTGIWDLLKLGVNWVGEKFWTSTSEVEDKTADAQLMLNQLSPEELKKLKENEPSFISKLITDVWHGITEWFKEDVFCEKWSGVPRASQCLEPMKTFGCLSCRTIITGTCSAVGVVAAELAPAFLTGGAANVAGKGAKAAGIIKNIIKSSKSYGRVVNTIDKLSELKALKLTVQNAKKLKSTAQVLSRPTRAALKLSAQKLTSKHKVFVASSFYKKSAAALDTAAKYSGLKYFAHLNEEAYKLGYRSVDNAFAKKMGTQAVISKTMKKTAYPSKTLQYEASKLSKEMGEMIKKERRFREIPGIIEKNKKMPGTSQVLQDLQMEYFIIERDLRLFYQKKNQELMKKFKESGFHVTLQSKEYHPWHQYIEIDLAKSKPDKKFVKLYRRLQKKFEFKKVQLDLKTNAETNSGAFFQSPSIDIGSVQAIEALEDIINLNSQHELRHAMFEAMRNKGQKSIFHTSFYKGHQSTLMSKAPYNEFLTSEEVYTFSTDLQQYAKSLDDKKIMAMTDDHRAILFDDISSKSGYLESILLGTEDMTTGALQAIREIIPAYKQNSTPLKVINNFGPRIGSYDSPILVKRGDEWSLAIHDIKKRVTDIPLVSAEEKRMAESIQQLSEELELKSLEYIEKNKSQAMPSGYIRREKLNALDDADRMAISKMKEDYFKTPEGSKLKKSLSDQSQEALNIAEERLKLLQKFSEAQLKEVQSLHTLLSKHQDGMIIETFQNTFHVTSDIHLEEIKKIREKMYAIASNVKNKDSLKTIPKKNPVKE